MIPAISCLLVVPASIDAISRVSAISWVLTKNKKNERITAPIENIFETRLSGFRESARALALHPRQMQIKLR